MSKILIYLVIMLAILSGSVAFGADKPELDTKTTLSIINTVMEFYYAKHHGDADKIQSMFIELRPYWLNRLSTTSRLYKSEKMEFTEIIVTSKTPLIVEVVTRFSYGMKSPPWDYLMILKKVGDKWKISHFDGLGLP